MKNNMSILRKAVVLALLALLFVGCSPTNAEKTKQYPNNKLPYLSLKKGQLYLSIYDAKTKENSVSAPVSEKGDQAFSQELFTIQGGYAVSFEYTKEDKVHEKKAGSGSLDMTDPNDMKYTMKFYDKKLHYTGELDLSTLFKGMDLSGCDISLDETGTKLAVSLLGNGFGVYDIQNKKWIDVKLPLKESQSCLNVAFMKNGDLSFFVSEGNADGDSGLYYFGLYNIVTKQTKLKKIPYIPKPVRYPDNTLYHSDHLLYLNDTINPRENSYGSGKVIVLDTNTMDEKIVHVDGTESTFSRITPDGRYMISLEQYYDKKGYYSSVHVNVYDTKTMDVVNDDTITSKWGLDNLYVNNKGFLVSLRNNKETKVVYYGL